MSERRRIYLGLGGNLGDRVANLRGALDALIGGGVSIDGARLDDANALPDLQEGAVLKVGKRHLFRLAR